MSTCLRFANCSMIENDRAPRLCGSSSAKCRPYWLSDETIFAIASTAGPAVARTGAPSFCRRVVAAASSSGSRSEISMVAKRSAEC